MNKMRLFFLELLAFFIIMSPAFVIAQDVEKKEDFVYDDHGKRDPLWELVTPQGVINKYDAELEINDLMLEGTMLDTQSGSLAIINGQILKINDKIGPYTVANIETNTVILIRDNQKYQLKLKKGE